MVLELGGNAAWIVDADADVEHVVRRMVVGAFCQSGQSCISVQRILVHERVYDALRDQLAVATWALKMGDPKQEETFIGPLINKEAAERPEGWFRSAEARGAKVLCGGRREGAMLEPTLLEDVPSWRADQMPYGGVKNSKFGREGVRYAIQDMTEVRMMVVRM